MLELRNYLTKLSSPRFWPQWGSAPPTTGSRAHRPPPCAATPAAARDANELEDPIETAMYLVPPANGPLRTAFAIPAWHLMLHPLPLLPGRRRRKVLAALTATEQGADIAVLVLDELEQRRVLRKVRSAGHVRRRIVVTGAFTTERVEPARPVVFELAPLRLKLREADAQIGEQERRAHPAIDVHSRQRKEGARSETAGGAAEELAEQRGVAGVCEEAGRFRECTDKLIGVVAFADGSEGEERDVVATRVTNRADHKVPSLVCACRTLHLGPDRHLPLVDQARA
jgi:hypothetical protein